jgi:ribonuclease Y
MNTGMAFLIAGVAVVLGGWLGWFLNNRLGARSMEAMRIRVDEMTRGARREAEKIKQSSILQTREEIFRQRKKADADLRSRKGQLQRRERDVRAAGQKLKETEQDLARQGEELSEREEALDAREGEIDTVRGELESLVEEQNVALERVSGLTRDEARRQLLRNLRAEARYEAASTIKEIKEEAQRNADTEARKILSLAIERAASDLSAERTVTHFQLPEGSDLRGRIIGHEGKNIRTFERVTGIQLLLDEDGESVTLSGFNPIQRELARRVLETLLKDGNIHPKRIEDLHRRNRKRLDDEMRKAGEQTIKELGVKGVHGEIVKLLGRLKYRTSYGQNVLLHSKEVAYLTGMMAAELRLDEALARRAGLLHDIGKAIDYEREGTHPEIGAEVATKFGEPDVVVNAIASHHEDCEVISPISVLVSAADSLSGARPGARRKSVAEYIRRIERLEDLANSLPGVEQSYALQAGREIRVIARPNQVDDSNIEMLATDLASKIQTEMDYPGKIKVTVIREVRAVEFAN